MDPMGNSPPSSDALADGSSILSRFANNKRFLFALFDAAPYGVFITHPDGRIAACNPHIARLLGYSTDELVGRHFNDITHPEDLTIGLEVIRALRAGDCLHATLEKRYICRDGAIVWLHLSVGVIRSVGSVDGAVEFFVTTFEDISLERQRKQELLESQQRLKGLLEAIPYALFCVNRQGLCVYYKPARGSAGAVPDDFVGKKLNEMLPADAAQTILDTATAVLSSEETFNVEYEVSHGEEVRHFDAHVAPYGTDEAVVLTFDITDRILAERDRADAQAAIIEGQREVLRQISTPLLPISDGIIAMPLVGPVDRERAQQMLSTLMAGLTSHSARTVIIDIAGVPKVDSEVAELLTRVTQVVKLLGAEALFAGVRPDVARNILALGIDLTSFRSAGSFQSAISIALRRNAGR